MVTVVRSFTLVAGAVLLLGLPLPALAQASRPDTSITRLGGPTRMTSPLRDTDQLARAFGSTRTQNDLRAVMDEAGLSALTDQVQAAIANGRVREVTVAPGTRFEWMAFRRGGRARVVQGPRWDGARPGSLPGSAGSPPAAMAAGRGAAFAAARGRAISASSDP